MQVSLALSFTFKKMYAIKLQKKHKIVNRSDDKMSGCTQCCVILFSFNNHFSSFPFFVGLSAMFVVENERRKNSSSVNAFH